MRPFAVVCPASACWCTCVHMCEQRGGCEVDVGLQLARHVAAAHPEMLFTPAEIERRRLQAQTAQRVN